ncbi:MAG TPA: amidohydrolase family protein [Solirubrobacteraceae bacterium]|nr:amidohydrolase family protein [Solirubrobacteraceae bacterium]
MRPPLALAAIPAAVVAAAVALVVSLSGSSGDAIAQQPPQLQPAPERQPGEGAGPFNTLVVRGATMIDGTGAEPQGPVDIVVRRNRISQVRPVAVADLDDPRPPYDADHEIDATGMYVMPGFIDTHVHAGGPPKNAEAEYPYKLWLAHGVTTVRGVPLADFDFTVSEKQRSERNEIVAPRIFDYPRPAQGWDRGPIGDDPAKARAWIRWAAERDVDGFKLRDPECGNPEVTAALLDEARKRGLGSTAHLAQICLLETGPENMNALQAARMGLGTVTHFYGHLESLLRPGVELFPPGYDYSNEQVRFSQVADWVNKIHKVGGSRWRAYLREQRRLGTVFDPTFNIYAASRDVMRMRTAEWHDEYTLPSLMAFYQPSTSAHGSYYWDWTTEIETGWKRFYDVWFKLVEDYHKLGGRITTGSDSGFIYQTYGFGYAMELEMLREAGLSPLEVIKAATLNGAKTLYEPKGIKNPPIGTIKPGKLADLVIVPENPLANLKTLYATGHVRLNEQSNEVERVGGVRWTVKDGIAYDAERLRADVRAMVDEQPATGERTLPSAGEERQQVADPDVP